MSGKFSSCCAISYSLVMMLVVFHANVESEHPYDYTKLVLPWPRSYCNLPDIRCTGPTIHHFVIRALELFYEDDTIVPSYINNTGCTNIQPKNPESLTLDELSMIVDDMMEYWPYIYDSKNRETNLEHWRQLWVKYGMCFDNSNSDDWHYFSRSLALARKVNLVDILGNENINPGDFVSVSSIAHAIRVSTNTDVEIRCTQNTRPFNLIQFSGVALCFDRDFNYKNCTVRTHSDCDEAEELLFPKA